MQLKSQKSVARPDTSAQDAARYGHRLAEIGEHLASMPGENVARARTLLKQAADAAQEAAGLMEGVKPRKLRLHLNTANQPELLVESARYMLERHPGDTPVSFHSGPSLSNLPFGIQMSARLVSQLRALLGDDAVWTEARS